FELSAILEREDARDALVSNLYDTLDQLPAGAVVGTSSLRREVQIRQCYPQLVLQPLRGNVDTRLAKLDKGDYDVIILAAAGLKRLGLGARIRSYLTPEQSLPAAGQGALAIETLAGRPNLRTLLSPLVCPGTTACAIAERAVSRVLGGSCQVPLEAYAQVSGDTLHLRALVAEPDGSRIIHAERSGPITMALSLGEQAAQTLLDQGAEAVLAKLAAATPV
ncbi:MAG: hydroxymethylbilane synthase, partial [Burkholderiales bacterium 21-58-4]